MSASRLTRWHVIALLAALLVMLFSAIDWWSTDAGEDLRRTQGLAQPEPGEGPEQQQFDRDVQDQASVGAEELERNMWQPEGALDRVVQLLALAAVITALGAVALRLAERRGPPVTAIAASVAMLAALAIAIDVVRTGNEPGGQIEIGAPLALVALGALAFGAARAARREQGDERPAAADRTQATTAG